MRADLVGRLPRVAALLAAAGASWALAQSPSDFAQRAEVRVPAGTSIARAALPAASIAALREANGGDLRVFNAAGQVLPYALINAAAEPLKRPERTGERIPALPIFAEASTTASTPILRIEEGPQRRVIEYGGAPVKGAAPPERQPRGLLFDTRRLEGEVVALDLDGSLPPGIIVRVTVDASSDLRSWQRLVGDAPVFDFAGEPGSAVPGPSNRRIALPPSQNLKDRYLRLTWTSATNLPVTALRTVGVGEVAPAAPLVMDLGAPASRSDNAADWNLPPGLRAFDRYAGALPGALALRLQTSAANTLMPVRISTRARPGDPWRLVASSVVYRLDGVNPAITLSTALDSQVRVEPLSGYSLAGVPLNLSVEYPPLNVLFVATGDGPFTVASGKAGLASAALPLNTLIPGYRSGGEFSLPVLPAQALAGSAVGQSSQAGTAATAFSDYFGKSTILWGVLILAVLVLGGLALSLLRNPKA